MKHVKRLRFDQQKILRAIRDGDVLLPELLQSIDIDPPRLARWLRRRFFREALEEMLTEQRARFRLELELLRCAALNTLRAMFTGQKERDELWMNICKVVLEEYDRAYRRRRRRIEDRRRNKGKKKSPYDFERDLIHPSMKHREEEILAILEKPD